ncbi:hypothetical protein IAT40_001610 [Kwoniella sp. CBS 6097]
MDFFAATPTTRSGSNTIVSRPKVKKGEKPIVNPSFSQAKPKDNERETPSSSLPTSTSKHAPAQNEGSGKGRVTGTGKVPAKGKNQSPLKNAKPIKRTPSINAEELFNGMKADRSDVASRLDQLQWRQEQAKANGDGSSFKKKKKRLEHEDGDDHYTGRASGRGPVGGSAGPSSQATRKGKGKDARTNESETRSMHNSQDHDVGVRRSDGSSKSRLQSSGAPTAGVPISDSESDESASTSDDELSLGNTPERHKHEGYRADEALRRRDGSSVPPSSSSPNLKKPKSKTSKGRFAQGSRTDSRNNGGVNGKTKATGEGVIIPSSPSGTYKNTPRPKVNKSKGEGKGKKRSSDDISSDEEDTQSRERSIGRKKDKAQGKKLRPANGDEATPRQSQSSKDVVKESRNNRKRVPSSELSSHSSDSDTSDSGDSPIKPKWKPKRESLSAGHKFFDELVEMGSNDNDIDYDILNDQGDETMLLEDLDDDDEEDDEDKAFLASYRSPTDLCPYCSEPMPSNPSSHLKQLKGHLEEISTPCPTEINPSARSLSWQRHIDFCSLHRAETSLIPLGIRDGYPENIDFLHLEERLEQGWIRERLDEILRDPQSSNVFKRVHEEIEKIGKIRWGGIKFQSKEENIAAVKPGYYGDLGRTIIINHFLNLRKWGYFPSLKSSSSSQTAQTPSQSTIAEQHNPISLEPLSWHDFVSHVLVPEASVLLIMQDRGNSYATVQGYEEAEAVRAESIKYGTWKFREEGDEAEDILEKLRNSVDKKRKRLRRIAVDVASASASASAKPKEKTSASVSIETDNHVINGKGRSGRTAENIGQDDADATPKPNKIQRSDLPKPATRASRSRTHSTEPQSVILVDQTPPSTAKEGKARGRKQGVSSQNGSVDRDSDHEEKNEGRGKMSDENKNGDGGEDEPDLVSGSQQSNKSSQSQYGEEWDSAAVNQIAAAIDQVSSSVGTTSVR